MRILAAAMLILFCQIGVAQGSRCDCSPEQWKGNCQATVDIRNNIWLKVTSDSQECSRVDWYMDGKPQYTIVTEGTEIEELIDNAPPKDRPELVIVKTQIQSCKICQDAMYDKLEDGDGYATQRESQQAPENGYCEIEHGNSGEDPVGTYNGECANGVPHGQGRMEFYDGGTYSGRFENGHMNGQGSFIWADGNRYEGEFRDNRMNGHGTYFFYNGYRYQGEFRDGIFNGQGTMFFSDGGRHEGEYRDGRSNGQGTTYEHDGDRQVGYFQNGQFWNGTLFLANGKTCEIEAHNAVRTDCAHWEN